jgi:hypothetical protein
MCVRAHVHHCSPLRGQTGNLLECLNFLQKARRQNSAVLCGPPPAAECHDIFKFTTPTAYKSRWRRAGRCLRRTEETRVQGKRLGCKAIQTHSLYLESVPPPAEVSPSDPPPALRFSTSSVSPCELLLRSTKKGVTGFRAFLSRGLCSLTNLVRHRRRGIANPVGIVSALT